MTTPSAAVISVAAVVVTLVNIVNYVQALGGSATTLAVVYGSPTTICGIVANQPIQRVQCWREGQLRSTPISPDVSFDFIAGGISGFAAVRSGGSALLYWNSTSFIPKRLYFSYSTLLTTVTMGDTQICAITNSTTQNATTCWRGDSYSAQQPNGSAQFTSISSGFGFSCGVLKSSNRVVCWGNNSSIASAIQSAFANETMVNIFAGGFHACGMNTTGFVICKGDNNNGQLNVPSNFAYEYFGLALGLNHTCGIRSVNHTVVCWGGNDKFSSDVIEAISFESVVAGVNFTCGLTTSNFSVVCWGPGWSSNLYPQGAALPFPMILPGPCVQSNCTCGIYPQSQNLCFGNGNICRPCDFSILAPPTSPPQERQPLPPAVVPSPPSRRLRRGLLAFAVVGSVGGFAGICAFIYFMWIGGCFGKKKVHNSVQPTITATTTSTSNGGQVSSSSPVSRSSTLRRQGSRLMRRQRSGTSSKHTDRAEEFLFSDLVAATNNFSLENKIGAGSFGVVYKGKLPDGREVAIKRGETGPRTKKFQEKESAFDSELAFLSRLHHKHLVRLVGYCEERDERLLVYEYMKNGALFDHLHNKNNVEKSNSIVNSWKIRIKTALDAARGIEYLHNYAVPPIIHRDIKSSNILIDANWIARVSDFGLSLMGPESHRNYSMPMKAAGTVGYIDPEYYGLNVLTAKSDVYGLGVVLLELLTGKRAIFKSEEENGGAPMSVVDFAVPAIMAGELTKILDNRVGTPEPNEVESVELVAYTAMHCVHLEGKDRPTMSDIVSNLERALVAFDDSHGSISSGPISYVSD
ncbi:putative serine/threonine-protein kinase-like protein CCR3 [Nicotiana tomentosiformis]|uniref:putative serine/threonine-protein kinase-like protein CCR3 n=1 Tax=Nicotiana tomentosiformis TaxID=4098 RepID=UPI00051AF9F3|nr:putative serine/threonine-protein kinase-like protein CCR3 [Nicotiana tomentosiformis]